MGKFGKEIRGELPGKFKVMGGGVWGRRCEYCAMRYRNDNDNDGILLCLQDEGEEYLKGEDRSYRTTITLSVHRLLSSVLDLFHEDLCGKRGIEAKKITSLDLQ